MSGEPKAFDAQHTVVLDCQLRAGLLAGSETKRVAGCFDRRLGHDHNSVASSCHGEYAARLRSTSLLRISRRSEMNT
jgi:hypothetical protein